MNVAKCCTSDLDKYVNDTYDVVVYESYFDPNTKSKLKTKRHSRERFPLPKIYFNNLNRCAELVSEGGILYVYGTPYDLPYYASYLNSLVCGNYHFIFKYWIVLNIDSQNRARTLQPSHQGLLLYVKSKSANNTTNGFRLNTSQCKVPHRYCSYCDRNLKDWGGKKHLMNPAGTALSDVWSDFEAQPITDNKLPEVVQKRLLCLAEETSKVLITNEAKTDDSKSYRVSKGLGVFIETQTSFSRSEEAGRGELVSSNVEWNKVYQEDCLSFMKRLLKLYPKGVFDLVFADPPYNLEKGYEKYSDDKSTIDYVHWCNEWLQLCAKVLKPGGSLMILNLPKWSIYHALYLHSLLDFRHWICWDAMADPRGKLLPAHYSLLYYTKPAYDMKFRYNDAIGLGLTDYVQPPDSPEYCLRQSCIRARKKAGDDRRVILSDVWFNVHRIKHRRDRDYHPCQLPEKLLDRIIRLTTDPGDKVFDPFAGVGTTAVIAQRLGREFITTEIDPNYVRITNDKLGRERHEIDLFGTPVKKSINRKPKVSKYSKKKIEVTLQEMALSLGRIPTIEEIQTTEPWILEAAEELYDEGIKRPLKAAKLKLRTVNF